MGKSQSNQKYELPKNPAYRSPNTQAEFAGMSYRDRLRLKEENPKLYEKFANETIKKSF